MATLLPRPALVDRLLDALGDALVERAGALLPDVLRGLSDPMAAADDRLAETDRGWAAAFDLDTTPEPRWLGAATGTVVPGGLTLEQQRAYVRDRARWRRGSPSAIREAIRAVLLPSTNRRVDLVERDGSPWHLRAQVWTATLPAGGAATVEAAARTQMPVGITFELEVLTGATFAHMTTYHGPTFAAEALAFPAFSDAIYHIPPEGTEI